MKKFIPFLAAFGFIVVTVTVLELLSLRKTNGHFCYPLDDTFIHMALAKNLALYGNWGITPTDWVSASSSPFFTAMLALLFRLVSVNIFMPMVLSVAGTVLALFAMQKELQRYSTLSISNQVICMFLTTIIGTLPAMTLLGMEHSLQIAFALLFVHSIASILSNGEKKALMQAMVWAALMTVTRYENIFLVTSAFVLLAWQKKWKAALLVSAAGACTVILFGLYAKAHGGFFIPNSVLLKGNQVYTYLLKGMVSVAELTHTITGLVIIALIIAIQKLQRKQLDRDFWLLSIFILASIQHGIFASFGQFYRYEAYLIVLGSFHLFKIGLEWLQVNGLKAVRQHVIVAGVFFVLLCNLFVRGLNSNRSSIRAIYNIYEQQYQMASFMKQFYYKQTIAFNDIGAVSYFADLNTVDLWGLGNNEVTKARKNFYYNNEFLQKLVKEKNTRVAVIYDSWFDRDLPKQWFKVATWEIPYNSVCGDVVVTFYGITETEASRLKNDLLAYEAQLPGDIKKAYFR